MIGRHNIKYTSSSRGPTNITLADGDIYVDHSSNVAFER